MAQRLLSQLLDNPHEDHEQRKKVGEKTVKAKLLCPLNESENDTEAVD